MGGGCGCGGSSGGGATGFTQINLAALDGLRQLNTVGLVEADRAAERIWMLDGQLCVANGTADGKKGCVTVPFLGVPVKLCWDLQEVIITPPGLSVKAKFTVSVSGTQFYSVVLHFKCADIANPGGCTVTTENDLAFNAALAPRCNWGCLRSCAPACITCGSDYWCWAACAGGCIIRCCRIW